MKKILKNLSKSKSSSEIKKYMNSLDVDEMLKVVFVIFRKCMGQ